jgi:hypothetical protein
MTGVSSRHPLLILPQSQRRIEIALQTKKKNDAKIASGIRFVLQRRISRGG